MRISCHSLRLFSVVFLILFHASSTVQGADESTLKQRIEKLASASGLAGMRVGIKVEQIGPQRSVIFEKNSDQPFQPASNQKLITSATALSLLSADFKFRTVLGRQGDHLVIIGSGDPSIGDSRMASAAKESITVVFHSWAEALKARGVTAIRGDLVFDDSIFEQQHIHPHWREQFNLQNWYTAPVGGLNFNDNCVDVLVKPAAERGLPAIVTLIPTTPYLRVDNSTKTAAKGEPSISRSGSDACVIKVSGSVSRGNSPEGAPSVPIADPGMFFASTCRTVFAAEGISINGQTRRGRVRTTAGTLPSDLQIITVHERKLVDLLWRVNKSSLNMFAEALLKTVGAYASREGAPGVGSYASGRVGVQKYLTSLGVAETSYVIDDGSGLSHTNRATPALFTAVLCSMDRHARREQWWANMAAPGEQAGTLRKRMKNLTGHVYAKTGYIGGVSALSGYVKGPGKQYYAFSVLCNDINKAKGGVGAARQLQDEICRTLATWDNSQVNR